jgi:hypothetical protein
MKAPEPLIPQFEESLIKELVRIGAELATIRREQIAMRQDLDYMYKMWKSQAPQRIDPLTNEPIARALEVQSEVQRAQRDALMKNERQEWKLSHEQRKEWMSQFVERSPEAPYGRPVQTVDGVPLKIGDRIVKGNEPGEWKIIPGQVTITLTDV